MEGMSVVGREDNSVSLIVLPFSEICEAAFDSFQLKYMTNCKN